MAWLHLIAEFDPSRLDWQGPELLPGRSVVENYNEHYKYHPYEAFEVALKSEDFKVVAARITT